MGCLTKVVVPKPKMVKIEPKTVDCIFIGYVSCVYRFIVGRRKFSCDIKVFNIYFIDQTKMYNSDPYHQTRKLGILSLMA